MTIHIHIGLRRTATALLHEFLDVNREALAARGYAVPLTAWIGAGHDNLVHEVMGKAKHDPEAGTLAQALAEADAAPNAILSSDEFEIAELAAVNRLRESLGDRPAKIIVYLRRQDHLIASLFLQKLRARPSVVFSDFVRDGLYHARLDFAQLLDRWAAVFGQENISARALPPMVQGSEMLADFVARAGFSLEGLNLELGASAASDGMGALLADSLARKAAPDGQELAKESAQAIARLSGAYAAHEAGFQTGGTPLDEAAYLRFASRYGPGNSRVAATYLSSAEQRVLAFGAYAEEAANAASRAALASAIETLGAEIASGVSPRSVWTSRKQQLGAHGKTRKKSSADDE